MSPARARACVIGAGISGLAATKELVEAGVEVDCVDMMPVFGGTFASYTWKSGQLTSSTISTWFSDFPVEDRQSFMTWREFVDYLGRYVDHFGFGDRIQLNCKVIDVRREGEGWRVRFRRGNFSNGHRFHPRGLDVEEEIFEEVYSHLVMSTGLHHEPAIPAIPGLDGFSGRVVHSRDYRDAEVFRGQRVVVVGGGESGSDIVAQVSAVAARCDLSLRDAPGTLFPKWIQGNTPDIRDDRLTYHLPRRLAPLIRRGHRRFYSVQREDSDLFEWAARSNWDAGRCSFNANACKSFGIPTALVRHGAHQRSTIAAIDGARVRFVDGVEVEADALIFATGFRAVFPMFEVGIEGRLRAVNELWHNAVDPEIGERLIVVGYARPHQINLITTAELQARMAALVISGRRSLPSRARMQAKIAADQTFMRAHYGERYERNPALVDQLYFTDSLAAFIGCGVPWAEVLRRDPRLAWMLVYAAISGAHHRLAGPGANWELAADTIKATPLFGNRANARLRWAVLSGVSVGAWLGAKIDPSWRSVSRLARERF